MPTSAPDATLQQKELFGQQVQDIMSKVPEADQSFQVESPAQSISGITLKPWDERTRDATTIQRQLQNQLATVAGQKIVAFLPPALPGAQGLPIQFVLKSTQPLSTLYPQAQKFLADATASGLFLFLDSDLKIDAPQQVIEIDRDKAAQLGLSMTQVGSAMGGLLGGAYTNYFSLGSRSYKVISQVQQRSRLTTDQVMRYPDRDRQRHADPGLGDRTRQAGDGAGDDHALPAGEFGDDLRRAVTGGVAGGGAANAAHAGGNKPCRVTC